MKEVTNRMKLDKLIHLTAEEKETLGTDKIAREFLKDLEEHNRLVEKRQTKCSRCDRVIPSGEVYYQLKSNPQINHCESCRNIIVQEISQKINQAQQEQQ